MQKDTVDGFIEPTIPIVIGGAALTAAVFAGLAAFGFIGEKYYHTLQLQYAFRDENTNAGGWFHVPLKHRTICHKWEHRFPLEKLKELHYGFGDTYDLPKKFKELVKEWKAGLLQEADDSGFAYMYLSFVQEAYEEQAALTKLQLLLGWWFISDWFFETTEKILNSEGFLAELSYYKSRVKYLRLIIENSNEYDTEAALYEQRVAHNQDLAAYQTMGAQPTIAIRKNRVSGLKPIE